MKKTDKTSLLFLVAVFVSILLTVGIWLLDPLLDRFPHLPDQGPSWYYWKLPQPEVLSRITGWTGYILHQLFVWLCVCAFIKSKSSGGKVMKINIIALTGNLFFILLHLLQTHLFYDGLAQDVPIWTSQYSVIGMLMIILIMLVPRRGIFFGKMRTLPDKIRGFFRQYHGYYISWALVFTFWFHPMDGDGQLLLGFFYMFLLFLQFSFAGTYIHFKISWITLLEVFVTFHGTIVALLNNQPFWTMFCFGFLFMFIVTQVHGLTGNRIIRTGAVVLYIAGVVIAYYFRGYGKIYEITFIPFILYGAAFVLAVIVGIGQKLVEKMSSAQ